MGRRLLRRAASRPALLVAGSGGGADRAAVDGGSRGSLINESPRPREPRRLTLLHGWEGPEEPIHDRTAGLVVPARTRADYARHPASWLVSSLTTALIGLAAGLAGRDDVTALPAVPGGTTAVPRWVLFRHRHGDPDVTGRGLHPARRLGRAAVSLPPWPRACRRARCGTPSPR